MVYTSNRDGGGSVPSGHLAHPPPEGRLHRTGIFNIGHYAKHCRSLCIDRDGFMDKLDGMNFSELFRSQVVE